MEKNFVIKKQYKVIEKIGHGGFAETFLALDQKTEKKCVLKYLSLKKADKWKSIELFEREAKILSTIDHPFIPDFIDFFTLETEEDMKLYLVQEFIGGKNLSQLLAEGRHFTEKEVVKIGLNMAEILEYLHNFSPPLIHRDIKPSNIIFVPPDKIYLIDFGAVRDKLLNLEQGGSTIIGTFGYMPMEQYEGRAVPGTDIYSLGVTLINLLSHKDPADMEKDHLRIDFRPHVTISKEFAAVIDKMIEPDYNDRYQTAKELHKALKEYPGGKLKDSLIQKSKPAKTKTPWQVTLFITVIILMSIIVPITINELEKAGFKKNALAYKKEKKYSKAISLFKTLENYKDSQNQIKAIEKLIIDEKYRQALKLLDDKEYEKALAIFNTIKHYEDSEKMIEQAKMYLESEKRFIKRLASGEAQELAISSDGKLIAYAKIYLNFLSVETGIKIKTINAHNGHYIQKIRLNSDGSILATAGGKSKSFKFWDTKSFDEIKTISIDSNAMSVDFHPDGKTVACGHGDGTITLWTYPSWEKIQSFKWQKEYISALRFSNDGKLLASGANDKTIHLWDLEEGKLLTVFEGHSSWINEIRFLPDGEHMVSGSSDESVRLWSLNTGHEILRIECDFLVNSIDLDDSGKVLACCGNRAVFEFWSLETGKKIGRLNNFGRNVYIVMYTPDKKNVVTCGYDINLWSAEFN